VKKQFELLHGAELREGNDYPWFSEFTLKALEVVNFSFGGMHHVHAPKWDHGCLRFCIYGGVSTWDRDSMTRLVVAAHRECVRVEVHPHTFRLLKVTVSRRLSTVDAGDLPIALSHPTLNEHLEKLGEAI